jgi:hypothetical protein
MRKKLPRRMAAAHHRPDTAKAGPGAAGVGVAAVARKLHDSREYGMATPLAVVG